MMNREEKISKVLFKLRRKSIERFLQLRDAMDRGDKIGNIIIEIICSEEGVPLTRQPTSMEVANATVRYWNQCKRIAG